jgi:hypothetical protein
MRAAYPSSVVHVAVEEILHVPQEDLADDVTDGGGDIYEALGDHLTKGEGGERERERE